MIHTRKGRVSECLLWAGEDKREKSMGTRRRFTRWKRAIAGVREVFTGENMAPGRDNGSAKGLDANDIDAVFYGVILTGTKGGNN